MQKRRLFILATCLGVGLHSSVAFANLLCALVKATISELGIFPLKIDHSKLKKIDQIHNTRSGGRNSGMFEGVFQDRRIIVKTVSFFPYGSIESYNRPEADAFVKQVKLSKQFSELQVAPRFEGVAQLNADSLGIVQEFAFPSWMLHINELKNVTSAASQVSQQIRTKWVGELLRIKSVLNDLNIEAGDLQALGTPEGKVLLIDFGDYKSDVDKSAAKNNELSFETIIKAILAAK